LDLGAGDGRLTAIVLEYRPSIAEAQYSPTAQRRCWPSHHLEHLHKRALLTEIACQVDTPGLFINLEVVALATPVKQTGR